MFYIGMGKDKRPWSTANRNDDWWSKALTEGVVHFEVEIIAEGLTAEEARIFEKAYIESYGLESLANRQH